MKVLIVGSELDSYKFHLKHIVNHFSINGDVHLSVGFSDDTTSISSLEQMGVKITNFHCSRKPNLINNLAFVYCLIDYCRSQKFDVVISFMPLPGFCSAIASILFPKKTKYGHYYTGQVWEGSKRLFNKVYWFCDLFISKIAHFTLCDSQSQSEFLLRNGISKNGMPIDVIGHGSLCGVPLCNPPQKTYSKKLRVGYLARKTVKKGALDYLELVRINGKSQRYEFIYAGPDESGGVAEQRFNELKQSGFDVTWYGHLDHVETVLDNIDVLVLPSYQEGFGTVVLDAAMRQVPTIGYKVIGLVDSIQDEITGLLVEPGDVYGISEAIKLLSVNRELLKNLGENARERAVCNFSRSVVLEKLEMYLNEL